MAFQSTIEKSSLDPRFSYEPFLSPLSGNQTIKEHVLAGKTMSYPIWISSMTGGTELANKINMRLAGVCGKFGLGMGLGSCRQLLESDQYLKDFDVRSLMPNQPLFANLGIAQIEQLQLDKAEDKIDQLLDKLHADGLIIHVNPLQEWLQPEGDKIFKSPIDTISQLLEKASYPIIAKEVGQGFGKKSMKALLSLPLEAVDFAANGGTNFSKLELFRSNQIKQEVFECVSHLGHDASTMVDCANQLVEDGLEIKTKSIIISGGIKNFLDGYYQTERSRLPSVYGMASGFLKYALESEEALEEFTQLQIEGFKMAKAFLSIQK